MILLEQIQKRDIVIGVIGLGYVGLPLAVSFALKGVRVYGYELNVDRVGMLKDKKTYIDDVSEIQIEKCISDNSFIPSCDPIVLAGCHVIIVCVPTPLRKTKDPDMSYIVEAFDDISLYLTERHQGADNPKLIILESTTYPGTCDEFIVPMLKERGFYHGVQYLLAFSPERIDPGNKSYGTTDIPKVVGGISKDAVNCSEALYAHIVDKVYVVSSTKTAEMVKLLENTFRAVNIGIINEFAMLCKKFDVNVWEVIKAAATKPFGFMPFYPGPGLGGHCLPIDPMYLSWKAKTHDMETQFINLANRVNRDMPGYVYNLISNALNTRCKCVDGIHMLFFGVTYKKDIADIRESPAIELMSICSKNGAIVEYHDPYIEMIIINEDSFGSIRNDYIVHAINNVDCIVITTDHTFYDEPALIRELLQSNKLVVDTRGVLSDKKYCNIISDDSIKCDLVTL